MRLFPLGHSLTIRIDDRLYNELQKMSKLHKVSISVLVRKLLYCMFIDDEDK